jgi:hypothetical protein
MTESQLIKQEFVRLRKFGCIVFNYNQKKPNSRGLIGHPDWLIITNKLNLVFIETKIGADKPSKEQLEVINALAGLMGKPNSCVYFYIVKDSDRAKSISGRILSREV